ncbi:MAG TPA: isoprenylcysteine carboxylmethyltransferase family protein [Candidatus Angelobacter sp.]|jgi:protein-S-isoprenylcysteine O-methyltransferase
MADFLRESVSYLWIGLWTFWLISARTAKRSVQRQSRSSRFAQNFPVILGYFLLFGRRIWPHWLHYRFFPESDIALEWLGLVLTVAGIAFAIWARLRIGKNWSSAVTIKEQHELIQTGPYRLVRHPIYFGLLLAFLGTAIVHGEVRGLIGFLLAVIGWGFKLRMEESFMIQQFGMAYLDYKQRVKALVPFVV